MFYLSVLYSGFFYGAPEVPQRDIFFLIICISNLLHRAPRNSVYLQII